MAKRTLKDLEKLLDEQSKVIDELKARVQVLESRPIYNPYPYYPYHPYQFWYGEIKPLDITWMYTLGSGKIA